MSQHEENDKKTLIFERLDKFLKAVVVLTCLTGVVAVAWLCTAGRQKARETAQQETEFVTETEPVMEAESADDADVTARAVPSIPYGYEDKTVQETETDEPSDENEDHYAASDDTFQFEFREAWPQHDEYPGWYDRGHFYEDRNYDRHEWPSWDEYEFPTREGQIYFFWF